MCGPQTLSQGWAAYVDGEGRTYYANTNTGESSWTIPDAALLPEGWTAHEDSEGRTYYANVSTGESSWTRPSATSPTAATKPDWTAHQDSEGRTFYVNVATGESSWTCPTADTLVTPAYNEAYAGSYTGSEPVICKEFGRGVVNTAAEAAAVVDQGSYAQRLEERLMCGGFFMQVDWFVKQHSHKFGEVSTDGSGYSLESYSLFREYSCILGKRCEHFLQTEGVSAEDVVSSMMAEEEEGKKFKSTEYLMAAINFELFVSLMLDFKAGVRDVSRWWEICQEESENWYAYTPAE